MMKDHQIAQLVNQLRDAAITYHAPDASGLRTLVRGPGRALSYG